MNWQHFFRDYLSFTRKERIGILVVIGSILFSLFVPGMINSPGNKPIDADTTWVAALRRLEIKDSNRRNDDYEKNADDNVFAYQYDRKKSNYYETSVVKGELFDFDPNTVSIADWKRLGLRDKTIQTIQNFLNKGGHFYKAEDLQRIYGLNKDQYDRLSPYIKIESTTFKANPQFVYTRPGHETPKTYAAKYSVIDINSADTAAFISLPGIGSKLALRIVTFRDRLGGFKDCYVQG